MLPDVDNLSGFTRTGLLETAWAAWAMVSGLICLLFSISSNYPSSPTTLELQPVIRLPGDPDEHMRSYLYHDINTSI